MGIEVSVIMNSYNKYPQNLLTLYALENQTFDLSRMEVILVDDGSNDCTANLEKYNPPFLFKYIHCQENTGRSKAKNVGINAARGEILIILDAEILVDPNFVEQHYRYHQAEGNLVITGCTSSYGTYTVIESTMAEWELKRFEQLANKHYSKLPRQTKKILEKTILRRPKSSWHKSREKLPIYSKTDIWDLKYKILSFFESDWSAEIVREFGSDLVGFYGPWMFVITRNISVRKSLINAVGLFYEGFEGWGYEDWELGYRIYKHGGKILECPYMSVYHQEHSKGESNFFHEGVSNYLKFYTRHPYFEVGVYSLRYIDYVYDFNLFKMNKLVQEFNILESEFPEETKEFRFSLMQFFKKILELSLAQGSVTQLVNACGLDNEQFKRILHEKNQIDSLGQYNDLSNTFEFLINL